MQWSGAFRWLVVLCAGVLSACASVTPEPPNYQLSVVDEPENRRFVFRLVSHDDRALCIDGDAWPTVVGDPWPVDVRGAVSGYLKLVTASGTMRPQLEITFDAGMVCGLSRDKDCGTLRLEPRATMETVLDYALFGDADVLAADKAKHFDLHPVFPNVRLCRNRS